MQTQGVRAMGRRARMAVAFVRPTGPRSLPSRSAIYLDATLAGLVLLARLATDHGGKGVAVLLATVPLAARRRYPLGACLLLVIGVYATRHNAKPIAIATVVFAGYSAVRYSRFQRAAGVAVLWLGVIVGTALFGTTALLILVSVALTVTVGYAVHAVSDRDRMLAEQEGATRRALELERARIASELHDVVTHSVSVMIVQAGAARQVLADSPDEARAAMLAVEASGRAAMTELRHLLGLLSPTGTANEPEASDGAPPPELEPQPGLAHLHRLVDRLTAAGLPIELHVDALPQELSPGLDLAVFRVIQEGLTNVIKHAGKPPTTVTVGYAGDEIEVEVADAGRLIPAAAPGLPAGARRGLIGLRERIALYGGELNAGPSSGGGWILRARFPVNGQRTADRTGSPPRGDRFATASECP